MHNESPVGLATILGLLPALLAGVIFIVILVRNGFDVEGAVALTTAIVGGLSLVGTAALRQWRAVAATRETPPPAPPNVEIAGIPSEAHEGAEA